MWGERVGEKEEEKEGRKEEEEKKGKKDAATKMKLFLSDPALSLVLSKTPLKNSFPHTTPMLCTPPVCTYLYNKV
jgi:hypothetical protein